MGSGRGSRSARYWLVLLCWCLGGCGQEHRPAAPRMVADSDGVYHVFPGDAIQDALDAAAVDSRKKLVRVHTGIYRPAAAGQALAYFNARHDGITLEGVGDVTLTASNPQIAERSARSFPAVVNHVLFFGDGISPKTTVRGLKITGANNFVTLAEGRAIEPRSLQPQLERGLFFYADGGGIKIFGRSYPTIENVEIFDNYTSPCGGGVSVEHRGFTDNFVQFRNCIFRNNRCQITGAAVDLLPGSAARIENCLFVGNVANMGVDYIGGSGGEYNAEHGSGALTVFPGSKVRVDRSTFTGNWNGADDKGEANQYTQSIFWMNNSTGGISPGKRYELDILDGSAVRGCFLHGEVADLRQSLDPHANVLDAADPQFDSRYVPLAKEYEGVGYRPVAVPQSQRSATTSAHGPKP